MALSLNKIVDSSPLKKADSFERSLGYSAVFHIVMFGSLLIFTKFDVSLWKKPTPPTSVVWTQTVKRPKPTIPDKLPAPMVPIEKTVEPKKEEINIKKIPVPEKPKVEKETAQEKMKKALENLRKKVKDDDRPPPKEDNFATQDKKQPEGTISDSEILALQATSIYSAYEQTIKETVINNFIWYKTGNLSTKVAMKIDPKGNVINAKIAKSSGDFSYDQATLRAIEKSNPLPAPPPELVQMFLQEAVEFKFERKRQ